MGERKDRRIELEDRLSPLKRRRLSGVELNFVGRRAPASFSALKDRALVEIKAGAADPNKLGVAYESHVYRPAPGKALDFEPVFLGDDWTDRRTADLDKNLAEVFGDRPRTPADEPVLLSGEALRVVFGPSKSARMPTNDRGLIARSDQAGDALQRDIDTQGIVGIDDPEAEPVIRAVV